MPWIRTRTAYKKKKIFCERCAAAGILTPGEIVHHKIELTPVNITDPKIALDENNLMLVCRDCHAAMHAPHKRRYVIDAAGAVGLYNDDLRT